MLKGDGSLKTEKQAARIREQALALQNEVRTATKNLLDLKADLAAKTDALTVAREAVEAARVDFDEATEGGDPGTIEAARGFLAEKETDTASAEEAKGSAEEAYNNAKEAYAYTYTDGETTVYVFAVPSGGNGYDLLMDFFPGNTVVFVSIAAE